MVEEGFLIVVRVDEATGIFFNTGVLRLIMREKLDKTALGSIES